jgi:lysyl-tRNA synthetase class 1
LDKSGKKISKSAGNVFTPQIWFSYGSTQSLILLMLKRFTGTRELSVVDIPQYMNEFDELEDIYFDRKKISSKKERAKLTGLYKYCWWFKLPSKPRVHAPYNLLAYLVKVAPQGREAEYVTQKLREYGYVKDEETPVGLQERIGFVSNWNRDFAVIRGASLKLSAEEVKAIKELEEMLQGKLDAGALQSAIFTIARRHSLPPREFFKILYTILLGTPKGPRLGPYIVAMGIQNVADALERAAN